MILELIEPLKNYQCMAVFGGSILFLPGQMAQAV